MADGKILIISGTNRPQANALKVANAIAAEYKKVGVNAEILSLAEMGPEAFAPSCYATKPPSLVAIQKRVLDAAGLHVVTPEYNGSFPGVLKYFIDMLQFPESFDRKPVAFVGESAGMWGGIRSVEQLIQIFGYRNAHIFPPRVFIPSIHTKFNNDGILTDAEIQKRLHEQAAGFARFVGSLTAAHQAL
jgi:NAD(P)H-dependent FMN reductase